jgi:hypothetical protein
MKTYELYIEEDGQTQEMGELTRTTTDEYTTWKIKLEYSGFVFYGTEAQLQEMLNNMSPNYIIGKEIQ